MYPRFSANTKFFAVLFMTALAVLILGDRRDIEEAYLPRLIKFEDLPGEIRLQTDAGTPDATASVTLEWDSVDDPRVAQYEVHWGTQSGQYQSSQQVAATSTTIAGLSEGETYYFAAKACDQAGEFCSDFSEELSTTIDYSPPVANFSESKTSGVGSVTVTFDDSSEGKIDSYRWDFGDGNSSSAATAVHTYDRVGTYTVSLTVTGPGGSATKTKTDLISVSDTDTGPSPSPSSPRPGDDSIAEAEFVTNPIVAGAELPIEAGEIALDHEWKRVNFVRTFIDPVVVSTSVSGIDDDPVTARIAAVDQSGFFIRLQEWEYLDDQHLAETVGYLVVERGSHQLPNGAWLEADDIPVGTGDSWQVGSFIAPFATSPVVLSSIATYNDPSAVVTRLRNISSTGFQMMMQGSEANGIAHATEMVSYVAWEASCGEINGYQFTVGKTADVVTHTPVFLGLTDQCAGAMTFTAPPVLLTDMQTTDGADTANLRWDSKGKLSARIWVDEEQSRDTEVNHTSEAVGYFTIGEASDTDGAAPSAPLRVEVGEAEVGDAWYRVDLEQQFSDPIVIAKLMSAYDGGPATIRIKDVDPTGFTMRVQEWDYLDDLHALERVGYMVVERGRHQLPNGDWIVADQLTSATMGFTQSSFGHSFQATPVVIASVASENDPTAVTTRIRKITKAGFETRLDEQELSDQNHAPETIHYIALEPATFVIDGISVEVDQTADAITHAQTEIDFAVQGTQLPLFLGEMQSTDGGDPSTLRVDQLDHGIATIWVEEEQSRDTEIVHTTETAGYVVIY